MGDKGQGPCSDTLRVRVVMGLHIKMYAGILACCLVLTRSLLAAAGLIALVAANSLSFVHACLSDPGRVNRKACHRYLADEVVFGTSMSTRIVANKSGDWVRVIRIDGVEYEQKYCTECSLFRIGGMFHCRECNCCVLGMDHHCIWFGNCIGRNNIRHFHVYLYTLVGILFANTSLFYRLVAMCPDQSTYPRLALRATAFALAVVYTMFLCILSLFTMFHVYVGLHSSTSREFIKNRASDKRLDVCKACVGLSTPKPDISFDPPCI